MDTGQKKKLKKYDIDIIYQKVENDILNNNSSYRILILGDIILDSVMYMKEAPYDQVLIPDELERNKVFVLLSRNELQFRDLKITSSDRHSLGGAAGTMATLLRIPNVHVDMVGIIGDDYQGNGIKELFINLQNSTQRNDVRYLEFYPIVVNGYPTITKYYYHCIGSNNQGVPSYIEYRFDREDRTLVYKNLEEYQRTFEETLNSITNGYDCIIIKDHGKGMINEYIIKWILQNYSETPIFIDPKYDFNYYKKLYIKAIIPNIKEASMGIKEIAKLSEEDVKNRAKESKLFDEDYDSLKKCLPNCHSFIIKSDKKGAVIYSKQNNYKKDHICPFPLDESGLKSNIGCGDTFDAYFIIGQLKGYSQNTSVKLANIAAGIKRKKEIGEVVSPKEICEELSAVSKTSILGCQDNN